VVRFADATTIVDTGFISSLFDGITARGINKNYVMDIRFDMIVQEPALIAKLARAGLKVVICGFESFKQEELDGYGKSSSAELISRAISILDDNGIQVRGNFVVSPDYTVEEFNALADYASQYRTAYAGYNILTPMPGSELYKSLKSRITDHDLSHYNFFNCVLPTRIPLAEFYSKVASLWMIRKGNEII
jgi:radical SAM superfamily enzyme YgiQ (UPF0313 family)